MTPTHALRRFPTQPTTLPGRPPVSAQRASPPARSAPSPDASGETSRAGLRADPPGARDDAAVTAWALAARDGDTAAADLFVRAVRGDLLRYLTRLTGDAQSAEDLTQDTLLRALRSLRAFEGRSSVRSWLLTIARRTAADRLRHERSRPRLVEVADWASVVERAQYRNAPGFEEGVALHDLLAALPRDRGAAFTLTQIVGLPYAEAAKAAGCPIGTMRSRVARARQGLLAQLASAEQAGDARESGAGEPTPLTESAQLTVGSGAVESAGAAAARSGAAGQTRPPVPRTG